MFVNLKNPQTSVVQQTKVGFSWTMFFFGALVPLLRADWKWFLLYLAMAIFTLGIAGIALSFMYNKIYIKERLNEGWVPNSNADKTILQSNGIILS